VIPYSQPARSRQFPAGVPAVSQVLDHVQQRSQQVKQRQKSVIATDFEQMGADFDEGCLC